MAEPLPSYAMPGKKPARSHKGLFVALVLVVLLGVVLLMDRESVLHKALFGPEPLSWETVWASLREYGYWLFSLYLVVTAAALFLESRNPDRTLAWLMALALLPVFGIVLYWFVGPNFRYLADKRRFRLPKPSFFPGELKAGQAAPLVMDTIQLLYRTSGMKLIAGENVTPLYDGAEAFARIKERLRNARSYILLESYIIKNDRLGNEIKDILIERAHNGVFVCVIYDAVGSWRMGKKFLRSLRDGGVYAYAFLPVGFPMFRGANYRNHRKILVIDGEYAYMGGMNIGDEYDGRDSRFTSWRDTHMEFGGQGVDVLKNLFCNDLAICSPNKVVLSRVRALSLPVKEDPAGEAGETDGKMKTPLQIIPSGPDTPWDTVQKGYFSLIARARERLWLTTPFLVPGGALLEALCMSSLSGVDVRILLPGKASSVLVHWANRDCFDELLRAGVRMFLYDPKGFVHSKTITCDGTILSLGSANLDVRSLRINFEVQAFLYDRALVKGAEDAFENDMRKSFELTFDAWRQRPKVEKVKESIGKLFSSLL